MAGKITEYVVTATAFVEGDRLDMSKRVSTFPDVFESQQVPFGVLRDLNLFGLDGQTLVSSKTHQGGGNAFTIEDVVSRYHGVDELDDTLAAQWNTKLGVQAFRINSTGNTLIGGAGSPSARLHVVAKSDVVSDSAALITNANGDSLLRIRNNGAISQRLNHSQPADSSIDNDGVVFWDDNGILRARHKIGAVAGGLDIGDNFSNADLLFSADTSQDLNGFILSLNDGDVHFGELLTGVGRNQKIAFQPFATGTFLEAYSEGSTTSSLPRFSMGMTLNVPFLRGKDAIAVEAGDMQIAINNSAQTIRFLHNGVTFSMFDRNGESYIDTVHGFGFGTNNPQNSAKVEIKSTTGGLLLTPMTGAQASLITGLDGLSVNVSSTDGVFTAIGRWDYNNGSWQQVQYV